MVDGLQLAGEWVTSSVGAYFFQESFYCGRLAGGHVVMGGRVAGGGGAYFFNNSSFLFLVQEAH